MITRDKVLGNAVNSCIKEIYSLVTPAVEWDKFLEENKIYSKMYKEWENFRHCFIDKEKNPEKWKEIREKYKNLEWENKTCEECIGPKPYEFYYLPKEILKDICDDYIGAYKINSQKELLDTIDTLKNYCKKPIVDKYIEEYTDEYGNYHPGYKGYDHPNSLKSNLVDLIIRSNLNLENNTGDQVVDLSEKIQDKFFEFLDMAGNFYNWNRDLDTFNVSVYLGPSPNSNRDKVIENWKLYRNKDIIIPSDEKLIKEYYGEDYD